MKQKYLEYVITFRNGQHLVMECKNITHAYAEGIVKAINNGWPTKILHIGECEEHGLVATYRNFELKFDRNPD